MDFATLPEGPAWRLGNLRIPGAFLGRSEAFLPFAITVEGDRITDGRPPVTRDMGGRIVFPCFTDMHTHLDKGQIWGRSPNPDGTFAGALATVARDRETRWTAMDVRRRMDFALRSAFAHGTRAIRTHLDSLPPQETISWPVFEELRAVWAGRIELQAACLVPVDLVAPEGWFPTLAARVAAAKGVLGCVTFPVPDLARRLDAFFGLAARHGLDADFHVDETLDPASATLREIARAVRRADFPGRVVAGHCCSLSTQDEAEALHTIDLVAEAAIGVVSLPLCNLYLQDRVAGRTPRRRGVTLVHEMAAQGVSVAFASDNTRDPFYAYGDLDMVEVMREATRIAHLDHSAEDWALAFVKTPSDLCRFRVPCLLPGNPADFVLFDARSWTELLARPQSDRIVVRAGRAIDRRLPRYSELDDLMDAP
jgi:cytosine deaminase